MLGALDPDHIVAVSDRIKLSPDTLRDADTSSAYRKDVRLLGDLLAREHSSNERIPCIPDCQYYGMLVSSSVRQSWCPGEMHQLDLWHNGNCPSGPPPAGFPPREARLAAEVSRRGQLRRLITIAPKRRVPIGTFRRE